MESLSPQIKSFNLDVTPLRELNQFLHSSPSELDGKTIEINADYVNARVGDLVKNTDLSKFIL